MYYKILSLICLVALARLALSDATSNLHTRRNSPRHKRVGTGRKSQLYKARDDPFAYPFDNNYLETATSYSLFPQDVIKGTTTLKAEPTASAGLGTTKSATANENGSNNTGAQNDAVLNAHESVNITGTILSKLNADTVLNETRQVATGTLAKSQIAVTFKPFGQQGNVPNRIKGKPLIMCMPDGIMFFAQTYFEFSGRVYARGRETNSKCIYTLSSTNSINATFAYTECGLPVSAKAGDANYQVEVVVSYDKENRLQSYLTHCLSQKLRYATDELPKRIDEALEELNIIPIKIESQAPMPQCLMRVVQEEVENDNHKYGPSNGTTVRDAYIGQTLKMEFTLNPSSAAFGFLIKNCTVLDKVSGERYTVIDNKGCSTDINIFAHPHYDTYHDLALVHWHAFRIPDNSILSFQCDCIVCSEIVDDDGNNGCDLVPTPPVCPEVVTSAALQNALLFDFSDNQIFLAQKRSLTNYDVNTSVCLNDNIDSCSVEVINKRYDLTQSEAKKSLSPKQDYCLSPTFFAVILSFSFVLFLLSLSFYVFRTLHRAFSKYSSNTDITTDSMSVPSVQRVADDQTSSIIVESSFTKT